MSSCEYAQITSAFIEPTHLLMCVSRNIELNSEFCIVLTFLMYIVVMNGFFKFLSWLWTFSYFNLLEFFFILIGPIIYIFSPLFYLYTDQANDRTFLKWRAFYMSFICLLSMRSIRVWIDWLLMLMLIQLMLHIFIYLLDVTTKVHFIYFLFLKFSAKILKSISHTSIMISASVFSGFMA